MQLVGEATRWSGTWGAFEINQVDVQQILCTDRFSQACLKLGLVSGFAFDLTEGYDMNKKQDREEAWAALERDEPRVLVGSPRCTPFSSLWRLFGGPRDPQKRHRLLKECEQHVRLCVMMYRFLMQKGRYFVHEHP